MNRDVIKQVLNNTNSRIKVLVIRVLTVTDFQLCCMLLNLHNKMLEESYQ